MSLRLDLLRCPRCAAAGKGRLTADAAERWLTCADCGERYPVDDGLPILLTEEGDFLGLRRTLLATRAED